MIRRFFGLFICVVMIASAAVALAGGPVAQQAPAAPPCGPAGYARGGNPCAFWGDAPFPGLCGGVVALPFLVVGTILGGNPMGPCAAPPVARYGPRGLAPAPYPMYGAAPGYPPPAYANQGYANQGMLGGLPGLDIASGLFSSITGGQGLL